MKIEIDQAQLEAGIAEMILASAQREAVKYFEKNHWGPVPAGYLWINSILDKTIGTKEKEVTAKIEEIISINLDRIIEEVTIKALKKAAEHQANKAAFAAIKEQAPRKLT